MTPFEAVNPVLPAWYDAWFTVLPILLLLWWFCALISIGRRAPVMRPWEAIGWFLFVTIAPVVGPLVWFLLGRRLAVREDAMHRAQARES